MILAHAGGLVANLAFAAPAFVLVIGLVIAKVRERRRPTPEDQPPKESP